MYQYPTESKAFGDVLTDAFIMGARSFKVLAPMILIAAVTVVLVQIAPFHIGLEELYLGQPTEGEIITQIVGYYVVMVVVLFLVFIALLHAMHRWASGDEIPTIGEALSFGASKLLVMLLALLVFLVCYVVGLLALVLPGIMVVISMSCFPVLIVRGESGAMAPIDSHKLIWGHWWWTLGLYLLMMLVIGGSAWALMYLLDAVGITTQVTLMREAFAAFSEGRSGNMDLAQIQQAYLIMGVISGLTYPFWGALQLCIVNELRLRRRPADHPDDFKGLSA